MRPLLALALGAQWRLPNVDIAVPSPPDAAAAGHFGSGSRPWRAHHRASVAGRQLAAHADFEMVLATTDRSLVPADWPATRYEQKCITGRPPTLVLISSTQR